MVQIPEGSKAKVVITRPDQEPETFECSRNRIAVMHALGDRVKLEQDNPELDTVQVVVSVTGKTVPQKEGEESRDIEMRLAAGTAREAFGQLAASSVTAQEAIVGLRRFLMDMSEISDLKGIMVTAVFEEAGVGGFTMLTQLTPVTPEDVIRLGEAAGGQVETFKLQMQKQGIEFPGDDANRIIIPGRGTPAPFRVLRGPGG